MIIFCLLRMILNFCAAVCYYSLDIEGAEFPVLKTIPWDKVNHIMFIIDQHMSDIFFSRAGIIALNLKT